MSLHRWTYLFPVLGSLLLPCPALADTIYNIVNYNSDQNGWTLSGTIDVLAVGSIGTIQSVDVILSNGATFYTLNGLDGDPTVSVQGNWLLVPEGGGFNFTAGAYPNVAMQYVNQLGFADYVGGVAIGPNLGWSTYYWLL